MVFCFKTNSRLKISPKNYFSTNLKVRKIPRLIAVTRLKNILIQRARFPDVNSILLEVNLCARFVGLITQNRQDHSLAVKFCVIIH